jgi:hypothetical protein
MAAPDRAENRDLHRILPYHWELTVGQEFAVYDEESTVTQRGGNYRNCVTVATASSHRFHIAVGSVLLNHDPSGVLLLLWYFIWT